MIVLTVFCLLNPPVYSTEIFGNGEEHRFDDSYSVSLDDKKFGDVEIRYMDSVKDYLLHADFRRSGDTVLTIVAPSGEKTEYDLHIERDTFDVTERPPQKSG